MTYSEYGADGTGYDRCRAAGGNWVSWDVWCPAPVGTQGGTICQVYYPQDACPTGKAPIGYSWKLPTCD